MKSSLIRIAILGVFTTLICTISAFAQLTGYTAESAAKQLQFEQDLIRLHLPDTYRNHLYELTKRPNIAGTPENEEVIRYMSDVMESAGLDVRLYHYDVWLAEPGTVEIELISPERITLPNKEIAFSQDPYTSDPALHHGWNAYSGSGDVTANVVYANYGRREDFKILQDMGIDVAGKIVLARYGGNFRGFKAKFAEEAGAVGLIIYTDPANGGFVNGPVYPDGIFSNEHAIQRGSLLTLDYFGDPLTPFEPALPLDGDVPVARLAPSDVAFHSIPVAPIGYGAAERILSEMDGAPVPEDWQGGLSFPYHLTGNEQLQVRIAVDQPHGFKRITNVIGFIEGSEYPDEWIILGSHFDAWGHGATDPNSGTAMLLTLSESLGAFLADGVRPKRSILIGHWDAEEFMLIGSSEWVEHLREEIMAKSVMYINADMSVTGPNFGASSSPSLKSPILEAAKVVPHPIFDGSLYEQWSDRLGSATPSIGNLGGGSDHVPFYMHAGIPSAGVSISGWVPIYHTNYDTFSMYGRFVDSTFTFGSTLASAYGVLATRFANAEILPYDLARYASDIRTHLNNLSILARESEREVNFDDLFKRIEHLEDRTERAIVRLSEESESTSLERKVVNAKLIQLERAFLHDEGMQYGPWLQSLYASVDPFSGYASWMLPGLHYVIHEELEDENLRYEIMRLGEAIDALTTKMDDL
jgi:N-acetylated-alpha-linked acidic dipeptidase